MAETSLLVQGRPYGRRVRTVQLTRSRGVRPDGRSARRDAPGSARRAAEPATCPPTQLRRFTRPSPAIWPRFRNCQSRRRRHLRRCRHGFRHANSPWGEHTDRWANYPPPAPIVEIWPWKGRRVDGFCDSLGKPGLLQRAGRRGDGVQSKSDLMNLAGIVRASPSTADADAADGDDMTSMSPLTSLPVSCDTVTDNWRRLHSPRGHSRLCRAQCCLAP